MLHPFRRSLSLFAASVLIATTALLGSVGTAQAALFGPTTNKPGNTTVHVTYINSIDIQTGGSVLTSTAAAWDTTLAILLFGIGVLAVCATRLRRV